MVCYASTCGFKKEEENCGDIYPNGDKAQLDYMVVNKKWINSVQNCKAYHSLEGISTDHRIVSLRIKLSLWANKKRSNTKIAYNWEHLINNEGLQNQFSTSLRNRYNILQHEDTNESANNTYQNFVKAHKETAEILIPQKEKIKRKVSWENEIITEKRQQTKKLARMKNRNATKANIRKHKQAQKNLETKYLNEQQKHIQSQIDRIENASENEVFTSLANSKWNYRMKKINKGQNKNIQPRRAFKEMDEPRSKSSWQITYCIW